MISKWAIVIGGGYGRFEFEGTEDEAEIARANKSRYEGACGTKYRLTNQTVFDKLVELRCWFFEHSGGSPAWLNSQIKKERTMILKEKVEG